MPMRSPETTLIALLVALLLGVAAPASADLGTGAETEANRFSWHPSIRTSVVLDDNVELENGDGNSDIGAVFLPRLELAYQGQWFDLGADLGADVRQYAGESSPSEQFYRGIGWGEFGLLPGLTFRVSNAYAPTRIDLATPADHSVNLVQANRTSAMLSMWHELPYEGEMRVALEGSRHFSEEFTAELAGGTSDHDFHSDFWEGSVLLEAQAPILGKLSSFTRTSARFRAFDSSSVKDFGDLGMLIGLRAELAEDLDFEIAAGYGLIGFQDGDRKHRFLGDMKLRYTLPAGTLLRLAFENRNVADIVGNDFIESAARLTVEHYFGERTAAEVTIFFSRLANETWNSGADLHGGAEVALRRQLSRRVQAEVAYRYWRNAGAYSRDDFSQNQIVFSVSYRR